MCFTKEISINSFLLGMISSILLIISKNTNENLLIAKFFMFVSLMQLIEYFMWNDLDCKLGQNKIATILGPLLNHLQPTILLLLTVYHIYNYSNINRLLLLVNFIYLIYVFYKYYYFINNGQEKCTQKNDVHLNWQWKYDFDYLFYNVVMIINILYLYDYKSIMISFLLSYIFFFYYLKAERNSVGELWCYSVNSIPLFVLLYQQIISK